MSKFLLDDGRKPDGLHQSSSKNDPRRDWPAVFDASLASLALTPEVDVNAKTAKAESLRKEHFILILMMAVNVKA